MASSSMQRQRFIPAWAGNTRGRSVPSTRKPVHPRVGGEHLAIAAQKSRVDGSSPRGRGTRTIQRCRCMGQRFIPAWAGNTGRRRATRGKSTVHPRVGGEHFLAASAARSAVGSSPRGRGTPRRAVRAAVLGRFIPAWAGNTCPMMAAGTRRSVHPRVGGEHTDSVRSGAAAGGSSPRGRGTHEPRPGPRA